jgi:DNA-binding MarR family transcriptional regulator/predicted N-acetyltransferase YhbS
MQIDDVARVRSFHRRIADSMGALDERFLGRDRPMAEARLLWELADGADVRNLRLRLDLDAAYLSRLLHTLEREGLIKFTTLSGDRRLRHVTPTPLGRAERAELDRRSEALARAILEPLSADERQRLTAAMTDVERLMIRSRTTIALAAAGSWEVRAAFERYFAELDRRFADGFDVARSNRADVRDLEPPRGLVLMAHLGAEPVGCAAMIQHPDGIAELKRMWVAPHVRGTGLGRRLLAELERHARQAKATVTRLETNRALTEAIAMYRSAGYHEVAPFNEEPYADHWFQKSLG